MYTMASDSYCYESNDKLRKVAYRITNKEHKLKFTVPSHIGHICEDSLRLAWAPPESTVSYRNTAYVCVQIDGAAIQANTTAGCAVNLQHQDCAGTSVLWWREYKSLVITVAFDSILMFVLALPLNFTCLWIQAHMRCSVAGLGKQNIERVFYAKPLAFIPLPGLNLLDYRIPEVSRVLDIPYPPPPTRLP